MYIVRNIIMFYSDGLLWFCEHLDSNSVLFMHIFYKLYFTENHRTVLESPDHYYMPSIARCIFRFIYNTQS